MVQLMTGRHLGNRTRLGLTVEMIPVEDIEIV